MTGLNTIGRSLLRDDEDIPKSSSPLSTRISSDARWVKSVKSIQPGLVLAWFVMAIVVLWALFPQWFTSYSATAGIARQQLRAPSAEHWLGTDALGRDLLARIIYGAGNSLSGAFVAVGVGLVVGTTLGILAGSARGRIDEAIMRGVDVLLSIPQLLCRSASSSSSASAS